MNSAIAAGINTNLASIPHRLPRAIIETKSAR